MWFFTKLSMDKHDNPINYQRLLVCCPLSSQGTNWEFSAFYCGSALDPLQPVGSPYWFRLSPRRSWASHPGVPRLNPYKSEFLQADQPPRTFKQAVKQISEVSSHSHDSEFLLCGDHFSYFSLCHWHRIFRLMYLH